MFSRPQLIQLRFIAGASLFLWLVALGLCWHHCATLGKDDGGSSASCCVGNTNEAEKSSHKAPGSICASLKKPFWQASDKIALEAVQFLMFVISDSTFFLLENAGGNQMASGESREPLLVFTPGVSLHPANSSLAPPRYS